ncbi:LytR/AlgR family response regulator transcription factor [Chitinophaga nivalis]|uniref:LytTR family DNA-binding domain-containing protein n=1 Tax=Chitinophaga nivalis TaxID=2991709 RepID=A0ABT3IV07_9BACT|nr:LytTR family DNA-binding domain-containing protein [Chitinophaga nivalis]MCW3462483.1 LytTR family DNA-binding domain-containing protein [Chitinophaga nivalis]MCW3487826.1 LytTR family DNA-binding domain-containing protein [Chitinophaga nivalis]
MRALIVDDEKHSRDVLHIMLQKYCPEIQVQAACSNGAAALDAIIQYQPELIFLDIEMPDIDGFQVLQACPHPAFAVIFTTAYDHYALQALHHSALDYLLKPIDLQELQTAVSKAGKQSGAIYAEKVARLLAFLEEQLHQDERLALPTADGLRMMTVKDILYCEAGGARTSVYLQLQTKPIVVQHTLPEMETILQRKGFFRVHPSFLVNLSSMDKYIKGDGGEIIMRDGHSVPVSRERKHDFLLRIERM